jgi:2-polyprenyl-3-methyl-5-hydroxy-6-metoxy-1,4-benzoquinol methylase
MKFMGVLMVRCPYCYGSAVELASGVISPYRQFDIAIATEVIEHQPDIRRFYVCFRLP